MRAVETEREYREDLGSLFTSTRNSARGCERELSTPERKPWRRLLGLTARSELRWLKRHRPLADGEKGYERKLGALKGFGGAWGKKS